MSFLNHDATTVVKNQKKTALCSKAQKWYENTLILENVCSAMEFTCSFPSTFLPWEKNLFKRFKTLENSPLKYQRMVILI